ncbi:phosphatase PAP2 family protein [Parapedobacter sp. DT-150]|uniref:phosphatase PAP2 family protein n=1 Tax=Parapedobacter sp. DT-150 TaxID=3396162 RepID=UPI003F1BBEE5
MKTTVAKFISTIGHPFLTVPVFAVFLLFSIESPQRATVLSLLIIGGIFVPIGLKTLWGVRKGTYTNLDVSDRVQRQKWFIATTLLLLAVTIIFWLTGQDRTLRLAMACALVLLILAQVVNRRIKASMHLAFHAFLGFLILHFNETAGIIFLLFAPLLAWSRIHLKRHVWKEVVVGMVLGTILGLVFWYLN